MIPGSGRSPGIENGNPLQYSCLGEFHGQRSLAGYNSYAKSCTRLSAWAHTHPVCCWGLVVKSCQLFCDAMDCSPPGSSFHGISQARILEWVAVSFSRGFPTQGLNLGIPYWQLDSLSLSHQGSPKHPDTWFQWITIRIKWGDALKKKKSLQY